MDRKFLDGFGLEKDAIDKILDQHSTEIGKLKSAFATACTERDTLKSQLAERDSQLEELKKSTGDADALRKQIADLQAANTAAQEKFQAELAARDYADAVNAALSGVKFSSTLAKNAFAGLLKEKQLKLENGKLIGFDDVLKQAQTDDPAAFTSDKKPPRFTEPMGGKGAPELTLKMFQKMSYLDKLKLKTEHPELYKSFRDAKPTETQQEE